MVQPVKPEANQQLVTTLFGETPEDRALVQVLLDAAASRLARRIPDLYDRTADDEALAADVARIEASAVVRVLRNPDGYRSETNGAVSYTVDTRAAAGFLTILSEEWAQLGASPGGMGSIAPKLGTAYCGWRPEWGPGWEDSPWP